MCAKCVGEGLGGLGRGPSTFLGEQGGIRARQQQEWPFLPRKSKPHHLERQDTRVKEQSVKFPHDYKMQNYTKIEKIDHFLMCIKTNKQKKSPKSPECNTEPLGRLTPVAVVSSQLHSPDPSLQARPSLQGTGEFLEFFLNILAGQSAVPDFSHWFLVGKPFCIRSLSDHPQI